MASSLSTSRRHCPFWSETKKECRLCQGGLFIPLDDHIEAYCITTAYPQCLQYSFYQEQQPAASEFQLEQERNRRRFPRVEASYKITLVRMVTSGTVASHLSTFAETLDLSCGGMRLATSKPLSDEALVTFSFDPTFPLELQESSGQVMWCNKEIDHPGYQAGIAFQDEQAREAMANYLDLRLRGR